MRHPTAMIRFALASALAGSFAIAGCGPAYYDQPASAQAYRSAYGVVEGIDYVPRAGGTSGAGAVVGAIAGGVLGNQIGSGRGNTAATIGGAIAGGLVGNEVERRTRRNDEDYRITVRLDDGSYRNVITDEDPNLRVGDQVVVDNDRLYRR
ncbi:MAG TPA: glycine zipper 2TM domain-containing protein [Casimicrobiaceae bacterium]